MPQPDQLTGLKLFRTVRSAATMSGIWTLLRWLLETAATPITIENAPKGRCLGILHEDGFPERDKYIIIDLRVMGQTVLLGWIQIL